MLTSFIEQQTVNQRHTSAVDEFGAGWGFFNFESDLAIFRHDLWIKPERVYDMADDSDSKGIFRRPDTSIRGSQRIIRDPGRPLGTVTGYQELNQAMLDELWFLFTTECDFELAGWFVQSKVAKPWIDD